MLSISISPEVPAYIQAIAMTRNLCYFLLTVQISLVAGQPYATLINSGLIDRTMARSSATVAFAAKEFIDILHPRDDKEPVKIMLRDAMTTTSFDSTSSTTESTSTATTSDTTTSDTTTSTSSTSTSAITTNSITTTTSASTTSTSSTSTSNSTTTTSSSTTTSHISSATSTASAELKEWNHRGNIAAIIFSSCLISLFLGVSIIHCARDRAKAKRIERRELLKTASTISAEPLVASKAGSPADIFEDRSSGIFRDNPESELLPRTGGSSMPSTNQNWSHFNTISSHPIEGEVELQSTAAKATVD